MYCTIPGKKATGDRQHKNGYMKNACDAVGGGEDCVLFCDCLSDCSMHGNYSLGTKDLDGEPFPSPTPQHKPVIVNSIALALAV